MDNSSMQSLLTPSLNQTYSSQSPQALSGMQSIAQYTAPGASQSANSTSSQSTASQPASAQPSSSQSSTNPSPAGPTQLNYDQIAQINMLQQMGRGDLANQMLSQTMNLPQEGTFDKWKNILTGQQDYGLSDVQKGIQSSIPLVFGLAQLINRNQFLHNNAGYMSNLANQQSASAASQLGIK